MYYQQLAHHECHIPWDHPECRNLPLIKIVPANWIESHIRSKNIRMISFYKAIFSCFQHQLDTGHFIVHTENKIHYWHGMNQIQTLHMKFSLRNFIENIFIPLLMEICFSKMPDILSHHHRFSPRSKISISYADGIANRGSLNSSWELNLGHIISIQENQPSCVTYNLSYCNCR